MTSTYAAKTEVSDDKSRMEIERTLKKHGADQFAYGWDGDDVHLGFRMEGRQVRVRVPLPARDDEEFTHTPTTGRARTEKAATEAYEQGVKARWRAVAIIIKAKLVAVEAGITTFEEEFLADIIIPGGTTVGEHMRPQLVEVYRNGGVPALLPGLARPALPSPRR